MKYMKVKAILTLTALALLLTFTVSGTLAYITTNTGDVENVFTPVEVDTEIEESFDKTSKSSIKVENVAGDTHIPVYTRVALVGNWCDESGNIVEPWNGSISLNTTDWVKGSDGYYYYKKVLPVGETTSNLLTEAITTSANNGLHLEITVVHQSIQSTPTDAVVDAWGFVPGGN